MKVASQSLLTSLRYIPTIGGDIFDHEPSYCGERGKFYWSQSSYDTHRKISECNNYVLLDSGLVVTYSNWLELEEPDIRTISDSYFLGWGVFHSAVINGIYYKPQEEDYK